MPLTYEKRIAACVAALRQLDAARRTDCAITEVAAAFGLSEAAVSRIACEHAHAEALELLRVQAWSSAPASRPGESPE